MAAQATGGSGLAARYSIALYQLADEAKALDTVAEDLKRIRQLLADSTELRALIASPITSRRNQAAVMEAALQAAGVDALVRRFIGVVAANRRLAALPQMIDGYLAELARRRGEAVAEVTTATALDDQQLRRLTDQLKTSLGAKVTVSTTVDPSLLGGMIVKVGSRMVDSSLRSKLDRLQLAMKGMG